MCVMVLAAHGYAAVLLRQKVGYVSKVVENDVVCAVVGVGVGAGMPCVGIGCGIDVG